jgi:RNA polymerase sigma-70 factor (ECF subfamily)
MNETQALKERDAELKHLVKLSQHGDEEAFGKLFDILSEPVYRFIYMRVSHKETAEDLLSLTFIKTWKNILKYQERSDAKFTTWLFQISHNIVRDYWRSQKKEVPIEEYMEKEYTDNTEELFDTNMQIGKLKESLQLLSENYQNVLTLRFINQLSVQEVADVMGKSNGTVRVMQVRAIKALRKIV